MSQKVKPTFAKVITIIQLTQMACGILLLLVHASLHWTLPGGQCTGGSTFESTNHDPFGLLEKVYLATALMYASYFVLFAQFYNKRYSSQCTGGSTFESTNNDPFGL